MSELAPRLGLPQAAKMKCRSLCKIWICLIPALIPSAYATSNYEYQPDEFVVIAQGKSPNGQYAIAAHGEGELGYDNFHLYLMDGKTGRKIGPLVEVTETLDTGAEAFEAKWSPDSRQVAISYRIDRRKSVTIRYRIANRRAYQLSGPGKE